MKKNPVQPSTDLVIDGKTYHLLFNVEATAIAEELTGMPLLTGLRRRDYQTPTLQVVRALLFATLNANHPDVSYDEAKAMVRVESGLKNNIADIWGPVLAAWFVSKADPDPEEDAVAEDPTRVTTQS